MNKITIACLFAILAITGYGQSPEAFSYQAALRDASGNIRANVNVAVRLDILQTSATGTSVYSESFAATTNAFGLINLQVGKGTLISGSFSGIDWSAGPYFIKISVDGTEMITSQMLSVPYALYAAKAANGFSGSYNDLSGRPNLAPIATTGSFSDLGNTPSSLAGYGIQDGVSLTGNQTIAGNKTFTGTISAANKAITNVADPLNNQDAATKAYVDSHSPADPGWSTKGNSNTDTSVNFIGNVDDKPLVFKVNNFRSMVLNKNGRLSFDNSGHSVFIGKGAGNKDDLGDNRNIFIGDSAGYSNTSGSRNVATGYQALYSNTSGEGNIATGNGTLYSNTTGYYNIALGSNALQYNSTGTHNIAIGALALLANTEGSFNTVSGVAAMYFNKTGAYNTVMGSNALRFNTSGKYNTVLGYQSLYVNETGNSNVALGVAALTYNRSSNMVAVGDSALYYNGKDATQVYHSISNTAVGSKSLFSNTTGSFNSAVGKLSLYSNTTGFSNTAMGYAALSSNTTGSRNTATGDSALYANSTGKDNVANGAYALFVNSTGADNTGIGAYSLYNNTSGTSNVAVGFKSLYSNSNGSFNSSLGKFSLYTNVDGQFNTALGCLSLAYNSSGSENTAGGYHGLNRNTIGVKNTALGSYSLGENTTGSFNVGIGAYALNSNTTSGNNTAVGFEALKIATGRDNTAMGYQSLASNSAGYENVAVGSKSMTNNMGNANTAVGFNSMPSNIWGTLNTAIGCYTDIANNVSNSTAIGNGAYVNANDKIVLGNNSVSSIGGYAPFTNFSDARLKENIVYSNLLGLNFITGLKTATYSYRADPLKRQRNGLIAQDVQKVLKDLGVDFSGLVIDDNADKTLNLSYSEFVIPLINSVQELNKKNQELEQKNKELEKLLLQNSEKQKAAYEQLKAEIDLLRKSLNQ